MIRLNRISKTYLIGGHGIYALNEVDLEIHDGEFLAVTGRSGSGKTTLLNILGCMDRPDSGDYFLGDQKVSMMDDDALSMVRNRYIGFVFQSFHLLPRLTALENVLLPRKFHPDGLTGTDRERGMRLLERVGLVERSNHRPAELSGGQRQRVAIARALINDPEVILADEPTGNLDSITSSDIMGLLRQVNRDGQTIVMVTHEPEIAKYSSRQILMQDGRVHAESA